MKRKTTSILSMALLIVAILSVGYVVAVAYAQVTTVQPNGTATTSGTTTPSTIIIQQPSASSTPATNDQTGGMWGSVAVGIIVAIGALAAFLHYQKTGLGQKIISILKDKEFLQTAVVDLAKLGAEAFTLNKDGTVTQADYDVFMETKVKPLVTKYAGQFGVSEQVQTILDGLKPRFNPPTSSTTSTNGGSGSTGTSISGSS